LKIRFPRAYDLFASALTVHLDAAGKAALFRRVCDRLRPGGRFVLALLPERVVGQVAVVPSMQACFYPLLLCW